MFYNCVDDEALRAVHGTSVAVVELVSDFTDDAAAHVGASCCMCWTVSSQLQTAGCGLQTWVTVDLAGSAAHWWQGATDWRRATSQPAAESVSRSGLQPHHHHPLDRPKHSPRQHQRAVPQLASS